MIEYLMELSWTMEQVEISKLLCMSAGAVSNDLEIDYYYYYYSKKD
jgi:hypothetical protein